MNIERNIMTNPHFANELGFEGGLSSPEFYIKPTTMKNYRLLKDLPGVRAGAIFSSNFGGKYGLFSEAGGPTYEPFFKPYQVEGNTEWFEEVVEEESTKEFTKEDMEECFNQSRLTHPMIGFKYKDMEEWLEEYLKKKS